MPDSPGAGCRFRLETPERTGRGEIFPGVQRYTLTGARMTLSSYRFAPKARFPKHHHPQEQIAVLEEGSITFISGDESVTLYPGQVLVIAPDVPHEAVAGSEGAVLWSVVAPARQSADDFQVEEW